MKKQIIRGCEARGDADSPYLTRYTLWETRWFRLCLHVFHRSDADELHDHPWDFYTLMLRGGYAEQVLTTLPHATRYLHHRPGALLFRAAEHTHRVILYPHATEPGKFREAVTLVLMKRPRRRWGFLTKRGVWQHWRDYFLFNGC